MTIENPPLPAAPKLLAADEAIDRRRLVELKVNICLWLTPPLTGLQKLSYALQWTLAGYPAVLVMMNPTGQFLANLASKSPPWVYLAIGGFRCCVFMPTSYIMGRYGKEYLQARIEKRERRTGRKVMWPSRVKQAIDRAAGPVRNYIANVPPIRRGMARVSAYLNRKGKAIYCSFPKWGWFLVLIRANGWFLMAAGATKMNPWVTGVAAVANTVGWLYLVAFMGEYIPHFVLNIFSLF